MANDAGWFGIAYYWSTADGMLPRQLRVRTYDKRVHRWRLAELDAEALEAGSAARLARAGKWVYIDTHLTPSVSEQDIVIVPNGAEPVGPSREFRVVCDVTETRPRCVPRREGS